MSDTRPPSLLRRVLLYSTSRGITEGLLGLRGILLAALLGPELFGLWALLRLAMHYASFAGLGVDRGMEYETARGANEQRDRWARVSGGYALLVFGTISALCLAASFLVADPRLALGLRVLAVVLPLDNLFSDGQIYLRARGKLRRYAVNEMVIAGLHLLLAGGFALGWGLPGAYAGFILASCSGLLLVAETPALRPAFSATQLRELLRVGFPVGLTLMLGTAMSTADRLVVAAYGGASLLGIYAFAVAIAGIAVSLSWSIRTVVLPDVYRDAPETERASALREHIESIVLPFAWLFPPLLGLAALTFGPVVAALFPRYLDAVAPGRVMLFVGVTAGFTILGSLNVVAAGRQRVLPLFSLAGLVLSLGLAWLALRFGLGLEGVAVGALLGRLAVSAGILGVAARAAGYAAPRTLALQAILPLVWCVAGVLAVARIAPGSEPAAALSQMAWFGAALLPLLPAIVARGRLLSGRGAASVRLP